MRLRNITGSREIIAASPFVIQQPDTIRGSWNQTVFHNDHPVHIEIGMGKGQFIMELAKQHPEINYIGIEKYSSVLLRAIQKMESLDTPLSNLVFLTLDVHIIPEIFAKDEIDRIYLNFSDPWPKDRHAKRRLESKEFLARYRQILKEDGLIEFKTDNRDLFEFALGELKEAQYVLLAHTFDLHNNAEMMENNIMTEYEAKFSAMGNPIHKYIIKQQGGI